MNSLNLLSSRVIGQTISADQTRLRSQGEVLDIKPGEDILRGRSYSEEYNARVRSRLEADGHESVALEGADKSDDSPSEDADEKTMLIDGDRKSGAKLYKSRLKLLVKRIADALTALLGTIGAPIIFVFKQFENEQGGYSPTIPFRRVRRTIARGGSRQSTGTAVSTSDAPEDEKTAFDDSAIRTSVDVPLKHSYSNESLKSTTSESETDRRHDKQPRSTKKSSGFAEEPGSRRQSIRIKLNNEEAFKKRKQKRSALSASPMSSSAPLTVDNIKSPTSSASALKATRYPHAPLPPRPLIPRRQPSYSSIVPRSPSLHSQSGSQQQKTLVIDLDETLIHSLAKGGRMSSGHMVEVKLNAPVALAPTHTGQTPPIIGPQHPILYYVHKRPNCDEFLRKVCKWYKLVVFTASVQEYADPVIDWLELERKYFVGRYYRQHCTFRNGAYIKDLSSIEPDLSKVIILDNSPVSYIFHEDNAIPIEGWINDPTDNDLLHLIPMLEALQYVTDVRALLALRRGEAEAA